MIAARNRSLKLCRGLIASSPFLVLTLLTPPAAAQEPGTITGRVVLEGRGDPGTMTATLVGQRLRTTVQEDGTFRFESVPPGQHLILVEARVGGQGVATVEVAPGAEAQVEVRLEITTIREELVVTATASPRRQLDVAQPTSVLSGEDLATRSGSTLGETLAEQPGVSSTYFGPGAGRPIIRGFGGDRIRVLEGGLGSADASSTSPDHAVSSDPMSAERIEVIRGPATLLYGSSAVGGVVNVLTGRIPDYLPEEDLSGNLHLRLGSVADERSGSLELGGALGGRFAWHADFLKRETDDYEIPGFAEVEHDGDEEEEEHGHEEEGVRGLLENSSQETESGSFGLSWIADQGFLGISVSGLDTEYGVPGHGHGHDEEEGDHEEEEEDHEGEGEAPVRIALDQRRVDLAGELLRDTGPLRGLKLRLGYADYEHVELEGAEVGTRFENRAIEGRLELVQRQRGRLSGTVGLQGSTADFAAFGEEAFVPPSTTDLLALFAYEELDLDPFRLQFGGRWETQEVSTETDLPDRSFDAFSASVGGIWSFHPSHGLAVTLSRSERIPTANELYADGPHAATRAFEIGDSGLGKEESLGLDLSLRRHEGRVTGSVTGFYNRFDDFIFERFTGSEEDGLPVIQFVQRDAEFWGAEVEAQVDLYRSAASHLVLELIGDTVRAELRDTGEPLPRIPPLRLGAGLDYHRGPWRLFGEVRWVDEQDRLAENETLTDSHTLVNAAASYRWLLGDAVVDLFLRGRNLTDEEARLHTSFLKDEVPLPGRDVSLGVGLHF
ncbi:MAG TPA: TonB-dependent receptor [Thermoanaerobaculia bacterium]|nr:TonB-dependent receptor [Thermoanaerobaculia bacterium]